MIQLRFTDGSVGTVGAIKRYTLHHDGNGSLRSICGERCTCGGRPHVSNLTEASAELARRLKPHGYSVEAVTRALAEDAELRDAYLRMPESPRVVGLALDRAVRRNMAESGRRDYASAMAAVLAVHPELRDDPDGEPAEKPGTSTFQVKRYAHGGAR